VSHTGAVFEDQSMAKQRWQQMIRYCCEEVEQRRGYEDMEDVSRPRRESRGQKLIYDGKNLWNG